MEYCIAQLRLLCSRQRCRLSIIRFTRLTRITRGSRSRRRRSNLGVSSRGSGSIGRGRGTSTAQYQALAALLVRGTRSRIAVACLVHLPAGDTPSRPRHTYKGPLRVSRMITINPYPGLKGVRATAAATGGDEKNGWISQSIVKLKAGKRLISHVKRQAQATLQPRFHPLHTLLYKGPGHVLRVV